MNKKNLPILLLALAVPVTALLPLPDFWIAQLNYIGLYALVSLGLVLLTGVGGLTSFGQAAFVGIGAYTYLSKPAPIVVNNSESVNWVTAAAATASPSVVTINVSGAGTGGNGSGVILNSEGFVLTNTHVVTLDGSAADVQIEVKTFDGHIYPAKIVGTDPTNDLAVIKVSAPVPLSPIVFADSDAVNVGDSVVAIGAPLGLANTVTKGILSALNRTIQVASSAVPENSDSGGGGLQFFSGSGNAINLRVLQTDAPINPGNSGGALLNQKGQLIGINVAIASAGGTSTSGSIGVGFAIPANVAKRIAAEIIATGKASHALLGAGVADFANSTDAASFSVGAEIKELTSGGAAQKAGFKVGDVVVKFNGQAITSASELTAAVRAEAAGAKAKVEVLRGGKSLSIQVTLGDAANLK